MKAKKIILTILLLIGVVSVKAQNFYYRAELAIVSQPVMTYTPSSVILYYDIQNIGDQRYSGYFYIYMYPDNGHYYDRQYVRIRPGRIKRVQLEIPNYLFDPYVNYMISPYYEIGNELLYFSAFEYFEPLALTWRGPRSQFYIVMSPNPMPRYYYHPNVTRYYYDGYRPPVNGYVNGYPYDPRYGHENHLYFGQGDTGSNNVNQGNSSAPATVNRRGSNTAGSMSERSESQGTNSSGATVVQPNSGRNNNGNSTGTSTTTRTRATVNDNLSGSSSSSTRSNSNSGTSRSSSTVNDNGSSSSTRSNSNSGTSRSSSTVKDNGSSSSTRSNNNSGTSRSSSTVKDNSSNSSSGRSGTSNSRSTNQSSSSSSSGRTRNR